MLKYRGRMIGGSTNITSGTNYTGRANGVFTLKQQLAAKLESRWASAIRAPGPPTSVSTVGTKTSISVSFSVPSVLNGETVTSYTITSSNGLTATVTSSPIVLTGFTTNVVYTFTVVANSASGSSLASANISGKLQIIAPGQQAYTVPGTYTWVAPADVTAVSVVSVGGGGGTGSAPNGAVGTQNNILSGGGGGGGLSWANNIAVTPGNSYTVIVGAGGSGSTGTLTGGTGGTSSFAATANAFGGGGGTSIQNQNGGGPGTYASGGGGGYGTKGSGGGGGSGNRSSTPHYSDGSYYWAGGGGGGAAGYSGNGGSGGTAAKDGSTGSAGSGGGGGGGSGGDSYRGGGSYSGGGVGLLGQGASGAGINGQTYNDQGAGSGGLPGQYYSKGGIGAGAPGSNYGSGNSGGDGAVRIIWGDDRAFPSTSTGDI